MKGLLAAATLAAAALTSAPGLANPPSGLEAPIDVVPSRGAIASVRTATGYAEVAAFEAVGGDVFVCVNLYDKTASRWEMGCGEIPVTLDPALQQARAKGEVHTFVGGRRMDSVPSAVHVDVSLIAEGVPQPYDYQDFSAWPVNVVAQVNAGISQPATGSMTFRSEQLCRGVRGRCTSSMRNAEAIGSMWADATAVAWTSADAL